MSFAPLRPFHGALAVLTALTACNGSSSPTVTPPAADASWEEIRDYRQDELDDYLYNRADEWEAFLDNPVGHSGVPLVMFVVLPDIFPELWDADTWPEDVGLWWDDANSILPYSLNQGMGSTPLIDVWGLDTIRMRVVNFSCAACHTGRVEVDGELRTIPGAPSNSFDINGWRRKLFLTVSDDRYTIENFEDAIDAYGYGDLYGSDVSFAQEVLDRTVFGSKGPDIMDAVRIKLQDKEHRVHDYLGTYSYGEDQDLLDGVTPGQLEAFGIATTKFLPDDIDSQTGAELDATLAEVFGPQPAMVDVQAVWRQDDRDFAQWDGNLSDPLIRNLGASTAVIGDPDLVDYDNVVLTTSLTNALPAPPYPFDVDMDLAADGQVVFDQACASCHVIGGTLIDIDVVGTDPGRALGLPSVATVMLAESLLEACKDDDNPSCNLPIEEVIIDRTGFQKYVADPLDGIWARAPYLHNGTVPTMEHLLVPSSRPATYRRGGFGYDTERMGFDWQEGTGTHTLDTTRAGLYNGGHDDPAIFFGGYDFESDATARVSLIEYLKTL